MKRIGVPTSARGFLKNLFEYPSDDLQFIYNNKQMYEVNKKAKKILSKIVRSKIGDFIGLIQRIETKESPDIECYFSFNRFLKTDKPYVIYVENPLALVHYSTERVETYMGKKRIKKLLNDKNLKEIVCMSKACKETFTRIYDVPEQIKLSQIYPMIPDKSEIDINYLSAKSNYEKLNCLYISSDFNLKGGNDILKAFQKLSNVNLTIVTRIDNISKSKRMNIEENSNIRLLDFNLTSEELNRLYDESNILLHPTRQDSLPLVILESLKQGLVILSTDLYAIPEFVFPDINGYLIEPKYRFFSKDNMPNKNVWNNRKKTIYSDYIDDNISNFIFEKIQVLDKDRKLLESMSKNSLEFSQNNELSSNSIMKLWEEKLNF